jgi:hypothetical protein
MTRRACEASKLLAWLQDILKGADAVDVDIFVVDSSGTRSTVHITLHDVPGPLGGLGLGHASDE